MDYQSIYSKLISNGYNRLPFFTGHKHRIIPNHEGGKYHDDNISYLTRQEHRIVHFCRYKIFGKYADYIAYMRLNGKTKINFKTTETHKQNISRALKGKPKSDEHKRKISLAKKGQQTSLGRKASPSTLEKMRQANLGKKASPETREKMRLAHLGIRKVIHPNSMVE